MQKLWTFKTITLVVLKMEWLYKVVIFPNDADGMANSVESDQTVPLGAV